MDASSAQTQSDVNISPKVFIRIRPRDINEQQRGLSTVWQSGGIVTQLPPEKCQGYAQSSSSSDGSASSGASSKNSILLVRAGMQEG